MRRDEDAGGRRRLGDRGAVLALVGWPSPSCVAVLDVDQVQVAGTASHATRRSGGRRHPAGAAMIDLDAGAVAGRVEALAVGAAGHVHRLAVHRGDGHRAATGGPGRSGLGGRGASSTAAAGCSPARPSPTRPVRWWPDARPPGRPWAAVDGLVLAAAPSRRLRRAPGPSRSGSRRASSCDLRDGIVVRFGPAGELDEKLFALDAILAKATDPPIATIDVRVPGLLQS